MSQISPPIRILLVCAVAFLAAWMLFLRPSTDAGTPAADVPPTTQATPPVEAGGEKADSLAGKAVEAANEATAKQDARAEQLAGGAGETAADPQAGSSDAPATATATPAKPGARTDVPLPSKEALATVPADVRRAIVNRKILVLGVVAPKGADDRLVRKSLGKVDKLHGRVFVKTVPVKRISRYGTITRGIDVSQTPSVVVVDYRLQATALAGWSDLVTIDQSVVDAIRYSGNLYTDPYLKQVAQACTHLFPDVQRILEPASMSEVQNMVGRTGTQLTQYKREIASLSTPKKWRSFSRATQADVATMATALAGAQAVIGSNPTPAKFVAADKRYSPTLNSASNRLNKRFDAHDVIACGSRG
jgi:hypothetical protein